MERKLLSIWVMLVLGQLHGYKSCVEKERVALLKLKEHLELVSEFGEAGSVHPTWSNDTKRDCCYWKGVKCSLTSGRVIEISIGSVLPKENSLLNLSLLRPFQEVQSLNLSLPGIGEGGFSGLVDDVEGYRSLRRLRNLQILDLSSNAFNNSILPFLNAATSLTTLYLRFNNMDGPFPIKELKNLTNLELLDLSGNIFNGTIPVRELSPLTKLKALDLSNNEFSGPMELQGVCKLTKMEELDLSRNKLVGQFPLCLTSLTRLRVLDLSSNNLTGTLPSTIRNLESLEYLSLSDNYFEGLFSLSWLTNFTELKVFVLDSKSNSLHVDFASAWKPKFQLYQIALRSCNLEKIPQFLISQKDLRHVDFSNNNIHDEFPPWLLANNTKLKVLRLRNNHFTNFQLPRSTHNLVFLDVSVNELSNLFPENIGWILPHLWYMNISNNDFKGNLPASLGNLKSIMYMDLSHNSFQGKLPRVFLEGCYSLAILKMSYNELSGEILPESTNFTSISVLYMDNNRFTGNIGHGFRTMRSLNLLDISNNNLTGVIPSWFDELPYIGGLLASNNLLEGEIPISLFNISTLHLLDLSTNILFGDIPIDANSTMPDALFLQENDLSGVIPNTLLGNVEVLDLRNNKLSGNIPEFINNEKTRIILLRGNDLEGRIPRQLCALRNIQLLDLANNRLNGDIPSCLSNISFGHEDMDDVFSGYYLNFFTTLSLIRDENVGIYFKSLLVLDQLAIDYSEFTQTRVEFATKYRYETYMGVNLKLLFGLDISENELSGEIPVDLGELMELQALNLSHNNLSGKIPESFASMKNLESFDISFNMLQGLIPSQLTELSGLAVFNVSYNNLSGVIPQGRQFNTFDMQSYLGNPFLCGQPTNISCYGDDKFREADNDEPEAGESTIEMKSFFWSFLGAYVTILVGIFASLLFDSPWSRVWFYLVHAFIYKMKNL